MFLLGKKNFNLEILLVGLKKTDPEMVHCYFFLMISQKNIKNISWGRFFNILQVLNTRITVYTLLRILLR